MVKWEDNLCPSALVDDIRSSLSINSQGSVARKIGSDFSIDGLYGRVKHSYDMDYEVLFDYFTTAILNRFKIDKLKDPNEVLTEFSKICNEKLKLQNHYYLVTSISVNNIHSIKRRTIQGCIITFSRHLPNKYRKARRDLIEKYSELNLEEQKDYLYVIISVSATDVKSAYKKAIESIDLMRAALQVLFKKRGNFLAIKKEVKYPSDSLLSLGKFHTLHLTNGKSAWNNLWYEADYKNKTAVSLSNIKSTEKYLSELLKKIRYSPFNEHLTEVLISYINAIDANDTSNRFLKLSSVIERVVKSDSSSVILKRVSFFYQDRSVHKELLGSLRKARNISAHAGTIPFNVEMKNYLLCKYVEDMLRFFVSVKPLPSLPTCFIQTTMPGQ